MLADAAGDDSIEMAEVGIDIERDAMKGHPPANADADGGDLLFASGAAVDPNPDASLATAAVDTEMRERADQPLFQLADELADIGAPPAQIEHHIGNPLAGAVIGVLAAATRLENRKTVGRQKVFGLGRSAGGVKRWMFEKPNQFVGLAGSDGGHTVFHGGDGGRIIDRLIAHSPFNPRIMREFEQRP